MVLTVSSHDTPALRHHYLRKPRPIHFPSGVREAEKVPENRRHFELRTALFLTLQSAFGDRAVIGSDQFVYWDPTDPKQCCSPDVMVRLGQPDAPFDCWKVWERGAPELCVEIMSKSDLDYLPWKKKLERYRKLGVRELVGFDPQNRKGLLRIWDNVEGDLVERSSGSKLFTRCDTLQAFWTVREDDKLGHILKLARDASGEDLFLSPTELAQRDAELAQRDAELAQRDAELAQRRVRELEDELRRRGG